MVLGIDEKYETLSIYLKSNIIYIEINKFLNLKKSLHWTRSFFLLLKNIIYRKDKHKLSDSFHQIHCYFFICCREPVLFFRKTKTGSHRIVDVEHVVVRVPRVAVGQQERLLRVRIPSS